MTRARLGGCTALLLVGLVALPSCGRYRASADAMRLADSVRLAGPPPVMSVPETDSVVITGPPPGSRVAVRTKVFVTISVRDSRRFTELWLTVNNRRQAVTKRIPHLSVFTPSEGGNYDLWAIARDRRGKLYASRPLLIFAEGNTGNVTADTPRGLDPSPYFYAVIVDAQSGVEVQSDTDPRMGLMHDKQDELREEGWFADVLSAYEWEGLVHYPYEVLIAGRYATAVEASQAAQRFNREHFGSRAYPLGPLRRWTRVGSPPAPPSVVTTGGHIRVGAWVEFRGAAVAPHASKVAVQLATAQGEPSPRLAEPGTTEYWTSERDGKPELRYMARWLSKAGRFRVRAVQGLDREDLLRASRWVYFTVPGPAVGK